LHLWKFLVGFCTLFEVNHGILCIVRRSSWDFVHYLKSIMGFCAFLEDHRGIMCIFGSFTCDFVHFWKFPVGLCIFESSSWDCVHFGSS
jgi:hypothetical protein